MVRKDVGRTYRNIADMVHRTEVEVERDSRFRQPGLG